MQYYKPGMQFYDECVELYNERFFKKMFVIPYGDYILELYVDSRTGTSIVFQWNSVSTEPQVIKPEESDWVNLWNEFVAQGRWIRSAKTWRKEVEVRKVQAVNAVTMTPEDQFSIRLYEAVKAIMRDPRFKSL